ncbi:MAG: YbhB/YbcL family Raf kinase inhibitor-like protein [Candidatus Omnitrophica bacterium]|nr:YbhB/YbcL family Raf kinase inhibitor-like protein [Candidatus Omnitrophota bacterium]MCM8830815.1 YbhB/YbcL family Raf kinase inhibitor-like protein [Candidatus Omnitrophota bacterium]
MYKKFLFFLQLTFFLTFNAFGFELKSSAFSYNQQIPSKYTCDGEDVSVPLSWSNPPKNTESFAIICEDPDAPLGSWIHWVIFNIPKGVEKLDEAIPTTRKLENGIYQGKNDFGKFGYGGPCPPAGKYHRYIFRIYALDKVISNCDSILTKDELIKEIKGHILAEAEIVGLYKH